MDRTEIIIEHVRNLIEKYANEEEAKREFCEEVEMTFFLEGNSQEVIDPDIVMWRKEMPKITHDDVIVFCDQNNELILSVTGTDDGLLNSFYTIITSKVIEELLNIPEIIELNPISIDNGDGDEGCIYFRFEGEKNRETRIYPDIPVEERKILLGL